MTITEKQKRDIASEIQDQYDYMDRLPMKGWAWEFLRRNKHYIKAFIRLDEMVKGNVWSDECDKILSEVTKVASPYGLLIGRGSSSLHKSKDNYLTLKLPPFKGANAMGNKYFGYSHHTCHVPRPSIRYCDFDGYLLFFPFPQIPDYVIYNSFDVLPDERIELRLSSIKDIPITESNDIFFIAVSKNANIRDLKQKMLKDIADILLKHKPRIVKEKWKYYLIVYDLKQRVNDALSYQEIANILIGAYPEDQEEYFAETRNINNWYKKADSLIKGGFLNQHFKSRMQSLTK